MRKFLFKVLLLIFPVVSYGCYEVIETPKVTWRAFKTPSKIGVQGKFKSVVRKGKDRGNDLADLLLGQMITIKPSEVSTKNPARDKNIKEAFFENLVGEDIKARVSKVSKKAISLEVFMNGKKKVVPLSYSFKGNALVATGHIDILDFQASKALKALNKRCYALHEGKTWSHVEIGFTQDLKKCAKL